MDTEKYECEINLKDVQLAISGCLGQRLLVSKSNYWHESHVNFVL